MVYLDDMSLGGSVEDVLHDLDIIKAAEELGLFLNNSKSAMMLRHGEPSSLHIQVPFLSGR